MPDEIVVLDDDLGLDAEPPSGEILIAVVDPAPEDGARDDVAGDTTES